MEPYTPVKVRRSTRGGIFRWVTVVAVGGLCLSVVAWITSRGTTQKPQAAGAPPPPAVVVTQAIQRTIPIYKEGVAQMVAVQTVDLRAQIGGTLEQVLFKEGKEVRQGQLLFVIDQRPVLVALKSAKAQFDNAQAALRQDREQVQLTGA